MGKLLYLMDNDQKPSPSQLITIKDLEEFRTKLLIDIEMMMDQQDVFLARIIGFSGLG